jgi:hypothetical protein
MHCPEYGVHYCVRIVAHHLEGMCGAHSLATHTTLLRKYRRL